MTLPSALGVAASLLVIIVVIELVRRQRLRERHATWWITFGIGGLVLAGVPGLLGALSRAIGIEVPANLVFFVALVTVFLVALQHSAEFTRLEHRQRAMAEAIALLEARVVELEKRAEDQG